MPKHLNIYRYIKHSCRVTQSSFLMFILACVIVSSVWKFLEITREMGRRKLKSKTKMRRKETEMIIKREHFTIPFSGLTRNLFSFFLFYCASNLRTIVRSPCTGNENNSPGLFPSHAQVDPCHGSKFIT